MNRRVSGILVIALLFSLLANHAGAVVTTWDPEGTVTMSPYYTGDLSGTWETSKWSTSQTEAAQASPSAWVEGTAAVFAVWAFDHEAVGE